MSLVLGNFVMKHFVLFDLQGNMTIEPENTNINYPLRKWLKGEVLGFKLVGGRGGIKG